MHRLLGNNPLLLLHFVIKKGQNTRRKSFLVFPAHVLTFLRLDPIHVFMIPESVQISYVTVYHPETPTIVQLRQICQFTPYGLIIRWLRFIVIKQYLNREHFIGLLNTDTLFYLGVLYQFSFLGRH